MSRISKELAHQIAIKLTEKSRVAYELLYKEYQLLVSDIYEEQTPKEVKECFKKHSDWFYTRNYLQLTGYGFNWEGVNLPRAIICNANTSAELKLTKDSAAAISASKNKYDKAKEEHKNLLEETEIALVSLGTHARIKENFPLAAPMLPPPMSNALICNFNSLTKRLQKQPEIKKQVTA